MQFAPYMGVNRSKSSETRMVSVFLADSRESAQDLVERDRSSLFIAGFLELVRIYGSSSFVST